jgi:glycosyltransferase involved in cell wall biosynthesis
VIIPCYNEEASIPYLSRSLDELKTELQADYDVQFIFVDDGSGDSTWETLNRVFGARTDSLLLRHEQNQGVSAALFTGLHNAREIACSMDCDCSYDPRELKPMLGLLTADVDLVTASPYHPEGRVSNVPSWRIALSRGASLLYQIVTGCRIHTFTSCLRVYRRAAAMESIPQHPGFLGVAELAGKFALSGRTIVEHPATLELRLFGASKMKIVRTIGGHLNLLASLAWIRLTRRAAAPQPEPGNITDTPVQPQASARN